MPNGGAMRNCALGLCCPPPAQVKALTVMVRDIIQEDGTEASKDNTLSARIARGLIERGLINPPPPDEAAQLLEEGSPTEEELDAMLAS